MTPLTEPERTKMLTPLLTAGWQMVDGRDAIHKAFKFKNFRKAFAWMTEMAMWAEKMDHHPEWFNVYNQVEVLLITHDANGLTERDIKLATRMDQGANT